MRRVVLRALGVLLLGAVSIGRLQAADTPPVPTREEVTAFVDEAVAFALQQGRDKALAAFNARDGGFVRGQLYIYAYDVEGKCLAHGAKPERVGRDCSQDVDPRGVSPHAESLKILAKSDRGWFTYQWVDPVKGGTRSKLAYIRKVDATWYLGSGTYETPAPPR